MGNKQHIPLATAEGLAKQIVEKLRSHCERIEIAGSIRRQKEKIGDIEIVAIPKFIQDMFGELSDVHELDAVNWQDWGTVIKSGHKYKQIELIEGINLDLFIVIPPAQWGVLFMLRTGSADFSHRLVTPKNLGGILPSYLRVKDGAIWSSNHIIPTPEEQDVFNLLGIGFIEPDKRLG
jgi:DNA polymerase (family 10)